MLRKLLLGTALATFGAIGSANAFIIDNFTQGPQTIFEFTASVAGGTGTGGAYIPSQGQEVGSFASILGGYRDLQTVVTDTQIGGKSLSVEAANAGGAGLVFSHNQGDGLAAYTKLTYDGLGSAGIDQNVKGNGETGFHIQVVNQDLAVTWQMDITDLDNVVTSHSFATAGGSSSLDLYLDFSLWAGIDFEHVTSLVFWANFDQNADPTTAFAVDTTIVIIETVPEPATMTLLGLGLAGLGLATRRRRKA